MRKPYVFLMLHVNYRLWKFTMKVANKLWKNALYFREQFRQILQKEYEAKNGKMSEAELNELRAMREEAK